MRKLLAIFLGKSIAYIVKTFKLGGGSAAPGLLALRVDPELIEGLVHKIPKNVVITGTNGKTTTARMLAHFAKTQGLKVIRNSTGSNLEQGIASTLISCVHPRGGKLNYDLGIWELDEMAFNSVAPKLKPDIVVFLNVFRDQLDRYGEVDTIIKKWTNILKHINKRTIVLINGDDQNLFQLQNGFSGKIESFGVKGTKIKGEHIHQKRIESNKLNYQAEEIQHEGLKGTYFKLLNQDFFLPLPGLYHVYDAVAAVLCAHKLGLPTNQFNKTLKDYSPAFGRVEKIRLNSSDGYIFLIKNPVGTTQVLKTITPIMKDNDRLLVALNDNFADGTDVSWIWDGEFEQLFLSLRAKRSNHINITCSGTRALDMAVRLKYAGFDPKQIVIEPDLKKAFKASQDGLKGTLYILPTYTAMLQLQKILASTGIKQPYWEES